MRRKKNIVIVGGINVYPDEIAAVLMRLPGVRDAAVFAVPDETLGELPVACVVLAQDAETSEADLMKRFLEHASREQAPSRVYIVEALPRGPSGKVALSELRELVTPRQAGAPRADDLALAVIDLAARAFSMRTEELSPETDAASIPQWDSLAHVNFLLALEKTLGLRFSPQEIFGVQTLGDAITVIRRKMKVSSAE